MTLRVTYDGQVFSFQEFGGISRYFSKLFELFNTTHGISPELIIKYSNNKHLTDLGTIPTKKFFPHHRFKGRNDFIKFLNRKYFRHTFKPYSGPQIFHPTYYNPYFLDLLGDIPFVLTIYDMAHERYPAMFSPLDHTPSHKKILTSHARRIIAISEHTKNDVINMLGVRASQIDVIPLATTITRPNPIGGVPNLPMNYLLYVGKRNTYKNFPIVLDALQQIRTIHQDCRLICAGGGRFSMAESEKMGKLGLKEAVLQMNVDDTVLSSLYAGARAFIYPSLYEGFGIPVLEAFACGCPTVLSNSSCFPEVGGDAAKYFDPTDVAGLVHSLNEILNERDVADDLRKRGLGRARLYSWEKTAQQTMETYQKALA